MGSGLEQVERQSGVMPERIRSQHARHHLGRPRKAVQANSTECQQLEVASHLFEDTRLVTISVCLTAPTPH